MCTKIATYLILFFALFFLLSLPLRSQEDDFARLKMALLGDTPLEEDLQYLTDVIGGRATGSKANLKSIDWALEQFRLAGVKAYKEEFEMPMLWLGESATASISGDVEFQAGVVAMPYSSNTNDRGTTARLVDGGRGTDEDFEKIAMIAKNAFVLIETEVLLDLDGLFREYAEASKIENRATLYGVAGVIYTSSRPHGLLYRHNASAGPSNKKPMVIMEREDALRALRLLRIGKTLNATLQIKNTIGKGYKSANVIGELPGYEKPDQVVIIGAHLDSWDLGDGALDNGCNVAMVLDIARQMKRLGLRPKRTIRFILWNGEEQGLFGSYSYTVKHKNQLDKHIMASSYDIGSGRITGLFTGGRTELLSTLDSALHRIAEFGPFNNIDAPVVGTDNYDFMMQGVPNLVAMQESANYGPNYHAASDSYDKVDLEQVRKNSVVAAGVTYYFATAPLTLKRQSRMEIEQIMKRSDLEEQMKSMYGLWQGWESGVRGRTK